MDPLTAKLAQLTLNLAKLTFPSSLDEKDIKVGYKGTQAEKFANPASTHTKTHHSVATYFHRWFNYVVLTSLKMSSSTGFCTDAFAFFYCFRLLLSNVLYCNFVRVE